MKNNSKIIGIELESLVSLIGQVVAKELQSLNGHLLKGEEISKDPILSRQEAAAFLGISLTTLWSLDKTRELPSRRIKSKVVYYQSDLTNFLNQAA